MADESPEVFDVLVVGGGPGGTAAAFRARELGLQVLVIDYDDLMKRIRDYSKDKLILPGFGGGDRMQFPPGGECIGALHFEPIDKDEMCRSWKERYREFEIPTRIGLELTSLEPTPGGAWQVVTWDHAGNAEERLRARHVVLAIGKGVPRRFDIPGNTEGISLRLTDAEGYVGAPACVIGGGTSAAEAVIAISNAKMAAGDESDVYWSYRGDGMPKVSKALAEVFFAAYVGNGNIRYFRRSEPVAVVVGDDHREYLSLRIDRRCVEGRPRETSHLEFLKASCIACIGEDLPSELLETIGIPLVAGGPRGRRKLVVNRYLESRQPNVYLVGDILSQSYLEAEDFEADPQSFREVKHRGNIKSALRDGVLVAEVIRQRLDGRSEIELELGEVEVVEAPSAEKKSAAASTPDPGSGSIPASARPSEAPKPTEPTLIQLSMSGAQSQEVVLEAGRATTIGRRGCDLNFAEDTLLDPEHASLQLDESGCTLRDLGSNTGVFLRIPSDRKLEVTAGGLLCVGRQFLLLEPSGEGVSLAHYDENGRNVARHELKRGTQLLGREAPDVRLDPEDLILSRRHLALTLDQEDRIFVKDLKSANGSFLRIEGEVRLPDGARFRVGHQHFAFSQTGEDVQEPPEPAAKVEAAPDPAPVAEDGASVAFVGGGEGLAAEGKTVCEVAEANGLSLTAECHSGICGSDPVRIVAGLENVVDEPGDAERETLEEICELEAGPCRLACMLRVRGPVTVEIL